MSEGPVTLEQPVQSQSQKGEATVHVRRIHRRDLNRVWEFLKLCFRDVNRETVEYQRPRSKKRFVEVYEEEGVAQLLFEVGGADEESAEIVGYAECAIEITGSDNWMNERYFAKRDMRPLFVEELAVHPGYQGMGIGSFVLEQLEHLARVRGCTHLVLEVADNNKNALHFYRARSFQKLDAAIFMAKRVQVSDELLPPRQLRKPRKKKEESVAPPKGKAKSEKVKSEEAKPDSTPARPMAPRPKRARSKSGEAT